MSDILIIISSEDEADDQEPPSRKQKTDSEIIDSSMLPTNSNLRDGQQSSAKVIRRVELIPVNGEKIVTMLNKTDTGHETKTVQSGNIENQSLAKNSAADVTLESDEISAVAAETKSSEDTEKAQGVKGPFEKFLEACGASLKDSDYENKVLPNFPKIIKTFDRCKYLLDEPFFQNMLSESTATAQTSAADAVIVFQQMYSYLLDNADGVGMEIAEEYIPKLKLLDKRLRQLDKRIKKLESTEIDFSQEQNSSYVQLDFYKIRFAKIYEKRCKLLKINPYAGRLMYQKIQFVSSKHNAINRAITKAYKVNNFPTYYDVEKCIHKCVAKHSLNLSESEIKKESEMCFEKLGKMLQSRRKKELYDVHREYIDNNQDPAIEEKELKEKLDRSFKEGEKRISEIVNKYVSLQEDNVSVVLSEDSDDSNYKDSGSDTE